MKYAKRTHTGPSQRQLRVGEQLRHVLAETVQRGHFHDPLLLDAEVTISEVRVSPDLKHAKAYTMTLGGEGLEDILAALNESASVFQKEINRQTNLKFTPKVRFVRDESFDEADKIESIIRGLPKAQQDD
jgi:ribosome-binding factor A